MHYSKIEEWATREAKYDRDEDNLYARIEIACEMKKESFAIELIAKLTKFSVEEVEKLSLKDRPGPLSYYW